METAPKENHYKILTLREFLNVRLKKSQDMSERTTKHLASLDEMERLLMEDRTCKKENT